MKIALALLLGFLCLAFFLVLGWSYPAKAQQMKIICGPKEVILGYITSNEYQEAPAFTMTAFPDGSYPMTFYIGKDSHTWSIILARPDGKYCIMNAGYNLQRVLPGDPA